MTCLAARSASTVATRRQKTAVAGHSFHPSEPPQGKSPWAALSIQGIWMPNRRRVRALKVPFATHLRE